MTRWEKLEQFDRRWIFLAMGLAIALPLMLLDYQAPIRPSERVKALYDEVEGLEPETVVLFAFDYDPATRPELEPFTYAVVRHLLQQRARIVILTLWDKAPPLVQALIENVIEGEHGRHEGVFEGRTDADDPPYVYGRDYVYLGFKEGKEVVIAGLGQNLRQIYPVDNRGTPLSRLPVMEGIDRLSDFPLIIEVSAGFPGTKEWVQQVVTRYNLRYASATTAVMMPDNSPYYPRQLFALVGGMRGAAEYETLLGRPGYGMRGLNVLTIGHVLLVAFIVFGNVIYWKTRKSPKGRIEPPPGRIGTSPPGRITP